MLEFDTTDLEATLRAMLAVCDDLPALVAEVEPEVIGHAVIGINRNVYSTEPGAYQRTGDLLAGLRVSTGATKNTGTIRVSNVEPYAVFVELGSGPNGLTAAQAQAYSAARPESPVYLGRSGKAYTIAGPFIAPAQAFGLFRMGQLFGEKIRALL